MRTVAIVDDEPITRMDLSDMLTDLGFSVVGEAADGFDAVELCRLHHPDIVLMDVKMPVFDGLTAAESILSEHLATCIILLTAFNDREIVERAGHIGITGYLVKPIDQKSLLPTIEVAYAQSMRLKASEDKVQKAQQKIREDRQIRKAQKLWAQKQQCSEDEAYHQMRKAAMDKRITMAVFAEGVLHQFDGRRDIQDVKNELIQKKKMTEEKAYQTIVAYAQSHGCSVEDAAKQMKIQMMREF